MPARDTAELPFFLRRHIFEGIDLLLEVIAEHESRCGFQALSAAFEELGRSKGENVEEVLGLLSYEDHFRRFVSEKFTNPAPVPRSVAGQEFFPDGCPFRLHGFGGTRRLAPSGSGQSRGLMEGEGLGRIGVKNGSPSKAYASQKGINEIQL